MAASQRVGRGCCRLGLVLAAIPLLFFTSTHTLADRCIDDCMRQCNADVATCRSECRVECQPRPQTCETNFKQCFLMGLRPRCCPENTNCCEFRDRATLRQKLDCCEPGELCCTDIFSGCYDPTKQQCTARGIVDCPSDRALCRGVCCESGEVCTARGCCPSTGCIEEFTCEREIQCTDPSKVAQGTWPACYCQRDPSEPPEEAPEEGKGIIVPGEGFHPGLGGVANCNAMFVCPPNFKMQVGDDPDVCICES
jgi:hypothetical protein